MKLLKFSKKRRIKISFLAVISLLVITTGLIFLFHPISKPKPQSTYPQDFASGKQVLYYTLNGIFKYDGSTKKSQQLTSTPHGIYGTPILSSDNTKIVYYAALTDKDANAGGHYDLWLYDLTQKKNTKLISNILLYPGYIQDPVWATDSQSFFASFVENNINILYRVDFSGKKISLAEHFSGNFFSPRVINDSYVVFNLIYGSCSLAMPTWTKDACGNGSSDYFNLGILNLQDKKVSFIHTNSDPYISDVNKLVSHPGDAFFSSFVDYTYAPYENTSEGKKESPNIIGTELLNLDQNKALQVKLPSSVKTDAAHRIQSISTCGDYVLTGQVADLKPGQAGFDRGYQNYYMYNMQNEKLQLLNNGVDLLGNNGGRNCGFNFTNHKIYVQEGVNRYPTLPIKIQEIDLSDTNKRITIDYSDLLPENLSQRIQSKCLGIGFPVSFPGTPADSFENHDFVYLEVTPLPYWDMRDGNTCVPNPTLDQELSGIYRLSHVEKSITKISPIKTSDSHGNNQTFMLTPNIQ